MPARFNINSDWLALHNIKSLRPLRKEKGLTAKELGLIVGSSDSAILDAETGKPCSILLYNALAAFFNWEKFVDRRPLPNKQTRELTFDFDDTVETQATTQKKDVTIRLPLNVYNDVKKLAAGNPISPIISNAVSFFLDARKVFQEAHS